MFNAIAAYNEYRRYQEVRVLARGSYGTAVLLRCERTGDTVVSKQIFSNTLNESTLRAVESEVQPAPLPSRSHPAPRPLPSSRSPPVLIPHRCWTSILPTRAYLALSSRCESSPCSHTRM